MNASILLNIGPSSLYMNRRFGGKYHIHLQGRKSAERPLHAGFLLG
jgi:hypothetical protein